LFSAKQNSIRIGSNNSQNQIISRPNCQNKGFEPLRVINEFQAKYILVEYVFRLGLTDSIKCGLGPYYGASGGTKKPSPKFQRWFYMINSVCKKTI